MSKEENKELKKFLEPYPEEVQDIVLWLREFVWDLYPKANELIYDNYNAVAFGWSVTEKLGHTFCSIAALPKYAHFGFYWGSEISDPDKILLGQGNQYRYILVTDKKKFPKAYIKKLVNEAYANSLAKIKDQKQIISGQTIIKSVSTKKRPDKAKKAAKSKKK